MTTTNTLDVDASVAQALSMARAGALLIRLTAQGVAHAARLADIKAKLEKCGFITPLVADIHFNPAAAFEAAKHVDKVRINPGNFFDPGRTFRKMEFTDEEYAAEIEKIKEKFIPFLELCRNHGTAIRVGVNHGSLSDRIMSRFGDGAEGMVESALEYLRICREVGFDDVVVSIKASDVPLMTQTVRLLAQRMDAEDMAFPLHLGVTEAGNALEGRIKSAVGIGSLLADGLGDTIRVSLSEAPENEMPVARLIIRHAHRLLERRAAEGKLHPAPYPKADALRKDPELRIAVEGVTDKDELRIAAAVELGAALLAGHRGPIALDTDILTEDENTELMQAIIQAAGIERFKAEIVACPGCGRTLYELPEVLDKIKDAFSHLKHLKIAVMGCIVNGPGEMAGADYGYVGAAAGNISLYRGIECVVKNIPQEEAVERLRQLIEADGNWIDK